MSKGLIAPSILSADFSRLGEEIKAVAAAGADWIHVDVMDGHFVPNITMGPLVVEAVRRVTDLPIDVHLMIEMNLIRESNVHPGVVLNPHTPLSSIEWVVEEADYVLIMSVNPGFGGQVFIENSLDKIRALRQMTADRGLSPLIQVDGGVNAQTIAEIASAGATVFVAGSAIFGSPDYRKTIDELRALAKG